MIIDELSLSYNLFQAREEEDGAEREGSEDCGGDHQVPVSFKLLFFVNHGAPKYATGVCPWQVLSGWPDICEQGLGRTHSVGH